MKYKKIVYIGACGVALLFLIPYIIMIELFINNSILKALFALYALVFLFARKLLEPFAKKLVKIQESPP